MLQEEAHELYRRIEDLPVKVTVMMPPEGVERKGIIQFHHGMQEHRGRYKDVMKYFSDRGYICAIHDVRGHGESIETDADLGYFGENGEKLVVEDTHAVTIYLKNNYPDLPLILIGHSFGSLVARAYIKKYDYELDRAFIIGCPADNKLKIFGLIFIELLTIFKNEHEISYVLQKQFDKQYDKPYRNYCKEHNIKYVKNGHICSDEAVVEAFRKDKKSGFVYTLNGYYTIMKVMAQVYNGNVSRWTLKNKKLPITFLSGRDDVYMVSKEKFKEAVNRMKKIGYINVNSKLYDGMFHEIFNEKDKEKVYRDILDIIEGRMTL